MKLFKTIDEKLADIGYKKEREDVFGARYVYEGKAPGYTHIVDLVRKVGTASILQSYDKDSFDKDNIGNTCVGLNYYELKLFLKKMKQLKMNEFEI